jgi:hypothetical protein
MGISLSTVAGHLSVVLDDREIQRAVAVAVDYWRHQAAFFSTTRDT